MTRNFNFFQYKLPSEPVQTYIDNALSILVEIKTRYPKFYKHFICPSEVLTLSGVRAFDTYYELGKSISKKDIEGLKQLLKKHNVLLLEENFEICNERNTEHRYSLVHFESMFEIPKLYRHLPDPGWTPPNLAAHNIDTNFFLWWATWKDAITLRNSWERPVLEWLQRDPWTAHNITFGILLGYPGEAICSTLYDTGKGSDKGQCLRANIKYGTALDGAQPIYDYLKEVADNPNIKDHEKLWSDILTGVYMVLEPQIITKG
jgi:hypothetical protein